MRTRILVPICMLSVALCAAAAPRDKAYADLRNDAHVAKLMEQADASVKAHRYEDALKKADEALALQPGSAIALNARGAALTELQRYDEAAKALAAAVEADPKAFPQQYNQGELLALQKKYVEAAAHFDGLAGRFGPLSILKYKIYLCYALAGNRDKAQEVWDVIDFPQDGTAWYFARAAACLMAGKKAEAARYITAAKATDPDQSSIYIDTLRDAGLLK